MKLVTTPAVILTNPKYIHNIGGTIRACSCFGVDTLMWTGKRIQIDPESRERIPREERMKGYRSVNWFQTDRPFDHLPPVRKRRNHVFALSVFVRFDHVLIS
jgi:hypothetical protein